MEKAMWFITCTICFGIFIQSSQQLRPKSEESHDPLLVRTNSGLVHGITEKSRNGLEVYSFLGIPYATPPLGPLRFINPVPVEPWSDIFNASTLPQTCMQKMIRLSRFIPSFRKQTPTTPMSEDCLKLNIWMPKPRLKNCTVIVWIHGGGYAVGSTSVPTQRGATLASEENVIVVSMNYRLASFGFIYFNNPEAPGNVGLYDQRLALQWLSDNIEFFGGNPRNVVLMGQSAGASSAILHAMSGLSDNLFNRIIVFSPPITPWAVMENSVILEKSFKLAYNVGCHSGSNVTADTNVTDIIACLRGKEPADLIDSEPAIGYNTMVFRPTIDGKMIPRMPETTLDMAAMRFTDLLIGSNKDEGTLFLTIMAPFVFQIIKNDANPTVDDYTELLQEFFHNKDIVKVVQYEYSNWLGLGNTRKVFRDLEKTVNDYFFTCSANRISRVFAENIPNVYKYYFVHPAPSSLAPDWFGAFHGAELHYVLGDVFDFKPKLGQDEIEFGHRMMRYIGNFARTGDPNTRPDGSKETITWPRHSKSQREYLVLAPNTTAVGLKLREKHCKFWDIYFPFISEKLGYKMINV